MNLGNSMNSENPNSKLGFLNLKKGDKLNLSKIAALKNVRFELRWHENARKDEDFDLDASALLLDKYERVQADGDIIYWGRPQTGEGVYSDGDDKKGAENNTDAPQEVIHAQLADIPERIKHVVLIITIYDAHNRKQNFGRVKNTSVRVINDDTEDVVCQYDLADEFGIDTCVVVGMLNRTDAGWEFQTIGEGSEQEMDGIFRGYGCNC